MRPLITSQGDAPRGRFPPETRVDFSFEKTKSMLPFPDVASTIPNPPAARGSLLELREETRNLGTREFGLALLQALRATGTLPRGGGQRSKPSSTASLWLVVRGENSSRRKSG